MQIATFESKSRIIIMLREPISYIRSIYLELLSGTRGERVRSLERALELEEMRRKGCRIPCTVRFPSSLFYREHARFDKQVERYLSRFPRKQIHFILLDDFASNPVATVNKVFQFLGVKPIAITLSLEPKNITPTASKRWRELDKDTVISLRQEFSPVVRRLSDQIGRDLVELWGY
jgi:hypothetical protein